MAYERATWLADVLRGAGLAVVEEPGWKERGLSETRSFTPRAVVWHHDASRPGDSPGVPAYMIRNFSTAAAQLWVSRSGVWHVIASGRAPHAGAVLPGKPGNSTSLGVETDHTTGEDWPPALLDSLRRGTAAILKRLNVGAEALEFHRTICAPVGRKVDPDVLNLQAERNAVAALMGQAPAPAPVAPPAPAPAPAPKPAPAPAPKPAPRPVVEVRNVQPGDRNSDVLVLQRALAKETGLNYSSGPGVFGPKTRAAYRLWQERYCRANRIPVNARTCDGAPGLASLTALGAKYGFEARP